jgi:hypothetical protein
MHLGRSHIVSQEEEDEEDGGGTSLRLSEAKGREEEKEIHQRMTTRCIAYYVRYAHGDLDNSKSYR